MLTPAIIPIAMEDRPGAESELATLAARIAASSPGGARAEEARLFELLAPRVRLYGLRNLRDRAAADDLAQDVLMRTIERLRGGGVREPGSVASFVLGMARSLAIGSTRDAARRRAILDRHRGELEVATGPADDVDAGRVAPCLETLAWRDRTVLVLSFYDEQSADEIASALAITSGNVRVIRHRALGRLRDCVERGAGEASS